MPFQNRFWGMSCFVSLVLLVAGVSYSAEKAAVLFVAPDGSDSGTGDASQPFATLERARDEIRVWHSRDGEWPSSVTVLIRNGAYPVRQTFALEAQDSGTTEVPVVSQTGAYPVRQPVALELQDPETTDVPVVYRAEEPGKAVFRGGLRVEGFKPVEDPALLARLPEEARGKVLQADLKPYGVTDLGRLVLGGFSSGNGFVTHPAIEVFFNGEALPMARYPNEGVLHVGDVAEPDGHKIHGLSGSKIGRILYEGDRPERWRDEPDAMLYGYWFFDWADSYERITAINTEKREIAFAEPYHHYGYRKDARYYAVNLFSEIDAPGEWYLDRDQAVLYLLPPADPEKAVVEISLLNAPLIEMKDVSNVRFEGITWELGAADAVQVSGGHACVFAGCTVRRCGGNGIEIKGGSKHSVLSCDIYSLGRGGVVIEGGDRKRLVPGGHVVENCHIHHLSRIDHTYTPAVYANGVGHRIEHNLMHHINSSAIRLNGNDHLVAYNETYEVLLESDDQGGADMWGDATFRGNVYRYNYWHHIGNWRRMGEDLACGQAGIRLDDAISGTLIQGNIFYRCSAGKLGFGGVQIHGGKENVLENNVFAECASAVSFSPWGQDRWNAFVAEALASPNIDAALYQERYPELQHLTENPDVNTLRKNLVWKCGQFLARDKGRNILQNNVITEDPACFKDASHGDFTLNVLPEALKSAGFEPIPFEKIGLYTDKYRGSIPSQEIQAARAQQP